MSLRETVNAFGRDVSAHFKRDSYCSFASAEETEGFVDTSAELDGSRGIAFLCDKLRVDFDGVIRQMNYEDIEETEIVESFESDYADELLIKGKTVVRVSDYSINKRFLKLLVDTLCLRYGNFSPEEREQCRRECRARSSARYAEIDEAAAVVAKQVAERTAKRSRPRPAAGQNAHERPIKPAPRAAHTAAPVKERSAPPQTTPSTAAKHSKQPVNTSATFKPQSAEPPKAVEPSAAAISEPPKPPVPELDIEEPRHSVPEDHVPLVITEEKIEWLSDPGRPDDYDDPDEPTEPDIEDMSREETISYLLSSINEINAPAEPPSAPEKTELPAEEAPEDTPEEENYAPKAEVSPEAVSDEPQAPYIPPVIKEVTNEESEDIAKTVNEEAPEPEERTSPFTAEPPSKDIYIKASRKIREICESGRLTREEIQTALKENLVSAAEQFAEIAGANADIPRHIAPKIEELRAASENLSQYIALG
ncbi:MAG: hypothetical protein K2O14_05690 [Oscillospiraceae bacterium]|nr:hypothetical protein [Oscillospiraceae bacterium]